MQAEQSVPTSVRKSWLLFKSKKIAHVVSAWIQSKNTLVKHFEDMRLCRPSKEYLQVKLVSMVDDEGRCSMRFTLSTSLKQAISD
ncbi:hypothetical protein Tco_0108454 [Tanacetum coccineum]